VSLAGLVAVAVAAGCLGVGGVVAALRHRPGDPASFAGGRPVALVHRRRLGAAVVVGVLLGLVSGWPALGLLGAAGTLGLPELWRTTAGRQTAARQESLAAWTEMLRDTVQASVGLHQAMTVAARVAPPAIAAEVGRLADRLASGVPPAEALARLAEELADPAADQVVCALTLASTAQAEHLGDLLGALAEATREEVALRLRIDALQAASRSAVRSIAVCSVGFALVLLVASRSYLAPFGTPAGELVLLGAGLLDASGLWLLGRMTRPLSLPRLVQANASRVDREGGSW